MRDDIRNTEKTKYPIIRLTSCSDTSKSELDFSIEVVPDKSSRSIDELFDDGGTKSERLREEKSCAVASESDPDSEFCDGDTM